MKKKLLCILLAATSALSFTACAAQDVRIGFDETLPWETVASYEKSTYRVEKFTRTAVGKDLADDKLIASGEYTTEIIGTDDNKNFEVKSSFSITFANIEEAIDRIDAKSYYDNRNLTDSFTSIVRFNDGMVPTYAEKSFVCAPRPNDSKQMTPYTYKADYATGTTEITRNQWQEVNDLYQWVPTFKSMTFKSGTKFDNEQLGYIVRGMTSTAAGGSGDFYIVNPYDMFLRNDYLRYTVRSTCAAETTGVKLPATLSNKNFLVADKEGELKTDEDGLYTVNCVSSAVALTTKPTGPAIKLLITDPSVSFKQRSMFDSDGDTVVKTSKLITQMRYLEYDVAQAKEKYNLVFTLSDYNLDTRD